MTKECVICGVSENDSQIYEGLLQNELVFVCESCAEEEGIPIIRKPTTEQLQRADERYSVRERMEKMSGKIKPISRELSTQNGINRLRMPRTKETNSEVIENYYWALSMARRRQKLTFKQLEERTLIPREVLESIERGRIPENFKELFIKLEKVLGIRLLKYHETQVHYKAISEEENKGGLKGAIERRKLRQARKEKEKKIVEIEKGNLDISKRENIKDITLNDLIELKKEKEKEKIRKKIKEQTEEMFGEDLEIEE
jgi:ribosome-binding protein aMBF1 (putative translation factor)